MRSGKWDIGNENEKWEIKMRYAILEMRCEKWKMRCVKRKMRCKKIN